MGSELVVPASRDAVLALDSATLYVLERAGEVAREILDGRIVAWTGEGRTQRQIADEIGCSQQAISQRQARLGVRPSQPNAPHKVQAACTSENGSDAEVVDAEVMPGQMALVPPVDVPARLARLSSDLVDRVEAGSLDLLEAEHVADQRQHRFDVRAQLIRAAIETLGPMLGHPVSPEVAARLTARELSTLRQLLKEA